YKVTGRRERTAAAVAAVWCKPAFFLRCRIPCREDAALSGPHRSISLGNRHRGSLAAVERPSQPKGLDSGYDLKVIRRGKTERAGCCDRNVNQAGSRVESHLRSVVGLQR